MSVISTGLTPSFLIPGATEAFGVEYQANPTTYDKIFELRTSDRAYEELAMISGFQRAKVKDEGAPIEYDTMKQVYTQRAQHVTYALGYVVTQEAIEDLKGEAVAAARAKMLARSMVWMKETVANDVLNNGFSGGPSYGDGSALLVSNHATMDGTQSNILGVAADLTDASLETMLTQIMAAKNIDGAQVTLNPTKIIVPTVLIPTVARITESLLRSGTADNDLNWLKGRIPEVVGSNFLTDQDAWFVETDAQDGLILFQRRPLSFATDGDFDTANARFKADERYSVTCGDFRGIYGSPGA